jgi:hypothetical protein
LRAGDRNDGLADFEFLDALSERRLSRVNQSTDEIIMTDGFGSVVPVHPTTKPSSRVPAA